VEAGGGRKKHEAEGDMEVGRGSGTRKQVGSGCRKERYTKIVF
jgi:hypothetical protein